MDESYLEQINQELQKFFKEAAIKSFFMAVPVRWGLVKRRPLRKKGTFVLTLIKKNPSAIKLDGGGGGLNSTALKKVFFCGFPY